MPETTIKEKKTPFEGFETLIRQPLEHDDPQSFNRVRRLFGDDDVYRAAPFAFLIQKLTQKTFSETAAHTHWKKILANKKDMETKLGRRVAIETAAIDYLMINVVEHKIEYKASAIKGQQREEWLDRIYDPLFYQEKLKDEISRAKRYNHALSVIMLDIDDFSKINEQHSFKVGDEILVLIVKIIRKLIRTVDIISRYSGDIFLIILPNTNKREAAELADRIRQNIPKRTKRIVELSTEITVTMSVAQCAARESSSEFLQRLETMLGIGKQKQRNAVYSE